MEDDASPDVYAEGGEFFVCDIDPAVIDETRKQIPLAIQKRVDMYGVVGEPLPA